MPYENLPSSISQIAAAGNGMATILSGISIVILLIIVIYFLIKKVRSGENLKYEFITIIAHKFRTPLTQVKWSVDELVKSEQDSYKKQSLLDIQQSNEKLIKLTGTLIELTDADNTAASSYALERMSICKFLQTICDTAKDDFHEKNIFFSVLCPPTDIFVNIDAPRMEFVIQTLLENALNYTPPGRNVEVTITNTDSTVSVSVIDHGIGIDNKDMNHIFTKFYRAQNAVSTDTEGFGVGLYLAQAIVRRHSGKLDVYSAGLEMGTTFTITLKTVQ